MNSTFIMSSKSATKQENCVITLMMIVSFYLGSALKLPSTAQVSTTWFNNDLSFKYMMPLLLSGQSDASVSRPRYLCGFYCDNTGNDDALDSYPCKRYFFSVVIAYQDESGQFRDFRIVWSSNRNNPVKVNATLELTSKAGLVLKDVDGKVAWSTNILNGKHVAALNMGENGNLMLLDDNRYVVWQSFNHPTNTLLPNQYSGTGLKLTTFSSDVSEANQNAAQFQYSMSLSPYFISFSVETNPPQLYFNQGGAIFLTEYDNESTYLVRQFSDEIIYIFTTIASLFLFSQLRPDGHLRLYEHQKLDTGNRFDWIEKLDVLGLDACHYPTVCGTYGICTGDGQCSCPISGDHSSTNYFLPRNDRQLNQGCVPIIPLACNASELHTFVTVENVSYSTNMTSAIGYIEMAQCKDLCLRNCSCKASIILNILSSPNSSKGYCYLLSEVLTMKKANVTMDVDKYQGSAFIKVQNNPSTSGTADNNHMSVMMIVGVSVGATSILIAVIAGIYFLITKRQKDVENEDDHLDDLLGMLSRFSYGELILATANFTMKLGQGGFGSVFEGVLKDGSKIAVKRLDGFGQVNKSFLAEVKSIGNIHHVNLVRLVGFCADKFHKLLVYEFMCNGSLDKWIYDNSQNVILDWSSRRKIIKDVAKGLEYLHEDCRQRILHLDVKPQNILLDENFNAKLSDFGLAKLIDRDQSRVETTMRGTPGYLAPEWLRGGVTEKVDVYSFGVVLLEILCGRKHFKESEPEEARHLLSLFKAKAEDEKLIDLIDSRSEDMLSHSDEIVGMMQIAAWCLVSDSNRRPSMSMVSKILEGVISIEGMLDYNILNTTFKEMECQLRDGTPLLPSILSGPR